jgi:hypothetical protein
MEKRFTVFASQAAPGSRVPVFQVFDRNVLCDPRMFSDRDDAQAEADRREAQA